MLYRDSFTVENAQDVARGAAWSREEVSSPMTNISFAISRAAAINVLAFPGKSVRVFAVVTSADWMRFA